jgi:hypothetical protein
MKTYKEQPVSTLKILKKKQKKELFNMPKTTKMISNKLLITIEMLLLKLLMIIKTRLQMQLMIIENYLPKVISSNKIIMAGIRHIDY